MLELTTKVAGYMERNRKKWEEEFDGGGRNVPFPFPLQPASPVLIHETSFETFGLHFSVSPASPAYGDLSCKAIGSAAESLPGLAQPPRDQWLSRSSKAQHRLPVLSVRLSLTPSHPLRRTSQLLTFYTFRDTNRVSGGHCLDCHHAG